MNKKPGPLEDFRYWVEHAPWWHVGAAQGMIFALIYPLVSVAFGDAAYPDVFVDAAVAGVIFGLIMGLLERLNRA